MLNVLALLFDNTVRSVQNWKKENRPIIKLLEKYFSEEELEEFLKSEKILKLELIKDYSINELNRLLSPSQIDQSNILETHYRNILFKINTLNIREKAILYHAINDTTNPTTKDELLIAIKNMQLVKKIISQIIDGLLLRKNENSLEEKLGYAFDKDNLYNFIFNFTSDIEIKVFLEKPYIK